MALKFSKLLRTIGQSTPSVYVASLQYYKVTTQAAYIRARQTERPRAMLIIRNLDATNVVQVGFVTVSNTFRNAPTTWPVELNPGEEYFDTGTSNQVYIRPKVDNAAAVVEVENYIKV